MKLSNKMNVLLSDEERDQISEFRWSKRIRSVNEAVRLLISSGLEAEKKKADAEIASA
jgi:hypothetical protein